MTRQPRHPRAGLSVLELLVVIVIIAILIALLLPGVQQTRSKARQLQCQSHLRQIGYALQMYSGVHGGLPPGYSPRHMMADGRWQHWHSTYAWPVHLLPYVDQQTLYNQLDINGVSLEEALDDPARAPLLSMSLAVFRCPDDLSGDTVESSPLAVEHAVLDRDGNNGQTLGTIFGGTSNFVGNCGYFATYHPGSPIEGTLLPYNQERTGPNNGLFYTGSFVRYADITDGASNTIAVGERPWFQGSSSWVGTANVLGGGPGGAPVSLGRTYWRINELPDPPGFMITPGDGYIMAGVRTGREGFGSYHPGGASFLMADGSVRFLSDQLESRTTTEPSGIDPPDGIPDLPLLGVFQRLGIRNDGVPVGDF